MNDRRGDAFAMTTYYIRVYYAHTLSMQSDDFTSQITNSCSEGTHNPGLPAKYAHDCNQL